MPLDERRLHETNKRIDMSMDMKVLKRQHVLNGGLSSGFPLSRSRRLIVRFKALEKRAGLADYALFQIMDPNRLNPSEHIKRLRNGQ